MLFDIGHVSVQVVDVDAAVNFAVEVLGMHEVERRGNTSYLTVQSPYPSLGARCPHHILEYKQGTESALDHFGLVATSADAVEQLLRRAVDHGAVELTDEPDEPGLVGGVRFAVTSGHVFEVYAAMEHVEAPYQPLGVRPHRLGHVTFLTRDLPPFTELLTKALGFRPSDFVGDPAKPGFHSAFFRCHIEHHQVGLSEAPVEGIHHYAFQMGSVADLSRLCDILGRGRGVHWGPGRHGAGDGIAVYFPGPGDVVIEAYTDLQMITDPCWEPRLWAGDTMMALAVNEWGPPGAMEWAMNVQTPLVDRGSPA